MNVLLLIDLVGMQMALVFPGNATGCHIFVVLFDDQIMNEDLRNFLCVMLLTHDLWIRNALRMAMSVRWKNSFLVHFLVLWAIQ